MWLNFKLNHCRAVQNLGNRRSRRLESVPMKIILRPLLLSFFITVAAAFAVFLTSPLHTATAQAPTGSGLERDSPPVDTAEQQAVLTPITQLFDGMAKRDA